MTQARWIALALAVYASTSLGACFKPPDVVIMDRRTALELQASGTFRGLDDDLAQAGLTPRGTPFTRGQLEAAGSQPNGGEARTLASAEAESDAARLDMWLARRCAGEALDGTVVETRASCQGAVDAAQVGRVLERENRGRWQIWTYLHRKRPNASLEEIRKVWREQHLKGVTCGGQIQRNDGAWEAKKC